ANMTGPKTNRRTRVAGAAPLLMSLDPDAPVALHRQIYDGLRSAILAGRLAGDARLPSTRVLAAELGVARNTVVLAFDQLRAEGYLAGRRGGGTRVSTNVPDSLLRVTARARPAPAPAVTPVLSDRWTRVVAGMGDWGARGDARPVPFALGVPAIDAFPAAQWARLTARRWRSGAVSLGYATAAGDRALRAAIASYVTAARGAQCTPDQILIVSGAQQALDLVARVFVDPGDAAWMEDPGYPLARAALEAAGARVTSVPVDADGLDVAAGARAAPDARLAYVTPSHQFPLGSVMSSSRRLALLTWARQHGAWVVEDDYDSEFRYATRPLACLQGLDAEWGGPSRVLYVGTFSKTLAPALRLGYLIVPDAYVDAFRSARTVASGHSPTLDQEVLADFIGEGHYVRHVRRVRALCADRQQALLAAAGRELDGLIDLAPDAAGLHIVGWLASGTDDARAADTAWEAGVDVSPLSRFAVGRRQRGALILGYAAFDERAIRSGVKRLARALSETRPLAHG
ncbi:MAG TPA: PLP-dependent aminotransferase family protein, partial [Gemmatimonadaceae bacterium]|nr:PLP-dependent aminotransferase family protein [Gemmatimonadaceae bacterium]